MSDVRPPFERITPGAALALLAALAVPLFFVKIGSAALLDPDEPYYAVPALEMLRTHTWAVPVFRGAPWFDKPILFYWMVLAGYKLFGVTEAAARVGSALAGLAGAAAMATLAPAGWRSRGAHVLGAIVLATSLEYAFLARAAVTDMTLTLFVTLGFLLVARALDRGGTLAAGLGGAAFGLAVLTKGPVGALVPAVALVAYGVWMRRGDMLRPRALVAGAAGFTATAAPWYAYMIAAHRDLVLQVFLGDENLGRFLSPEHHQMPFFYVAVFAVGMIPWSAALVPGLGHALRAAWRRDEGSGTSPGPAYALFWFGAVVGIFSLSASKLLTYVLPAFPPAAWLVAAWWTGALSGRPRRAGATIAAAAGAVLAVLAGVAIVVVARTPGYAGAFVPLAAVAAVLAAGGVAGLLAVRSGRLALFTGVQAAMTIAVVLGGVLFALPRIEAQESTRPLVAALTSRGLSDRLDGAFRVPDVSLDFYLGRAIPRLEDPARLARAVARDPGGLWVFKTHEISAIAARAGLDAEPVLVEGRRAVVRLSPAGARTPAGERR